jgi:LysR family transcriptional regulator, regulator for bpeEF and oprC
MDHLLNLKVFARLVELRSFTRTAAQLGMAPASVTTHLAQLENHLGVRLVHRNTRKFSITEEGRLLYEAALVLIQDFQQIEDRFRNEGCTAHGLLRISVAPLTATRILIPALPGFLERYPDIKIELSVSTNFVDLVQEGLDCAIRAGTLPDSTLISRRLGFCRLSTVASPGYLAKHGEPASPEDIGRHTCIANLSPSTGRTREWVFEKDHVRQTLQVSGPLTFGAVEASVQAAALGMGIAQAVSLASVDLIRRGELKEILAEWSAVGPVVQLVYEKSRMPSARLRAFIEFAMEVFPPQLNDRTAHS